MTRHPYVILFGGGDDLVKEGGDAPPIILMFHSPCFSHRKTLPILFQHERIGDGTSAPRSLSVPAIWDDLPVVCNDLHPGLRCLPDISDDGLDLTIPFGSLAQFDVVRVHADGFKNDAKLVAVILHPLELIRIPTSRRTFP